MILVVDNYDSFTWNLVHYLAELGAETRVVRNDDLTAAEALALKPEALLMAGVMVLGPGVRFDEPTAAQPLFPNG